MTEQENTDRQQFPCGQCGATLHYAPGKGTLKCHFCGHENPITPSGAPIEELDYHATLHRLSHQAGSQPRQTLFEATKASSGQQGVLVHCDECGAEYTLGANMHADHCEFCGSTVVVETKQHRPLEPQGVLPFEITADEAKTAYKSWLNKLWFAPNKLKELARSDRELSGIYVPYWTFDSDAKSAYQGQRGTYYQVPQQVVVTVNGQRQVQTRMVTKIRWTPVSGQVRRNFDDVLVDASFSLPQKILRRLNSWDLSTLKSYQPEYLSGFKSEMYQGDPKQGYQQAEKIMENVLRKDIQQDIGGDLQRISHMQTQHDDISFKHILLPIWMAAYKFGNKSYRFVINGQTGEVQGERPYSIWKIGLLAIVVLAAVTGYLFVAQTTGAGY